MEKRRKRRTGLNLGDCLTVLSNEEATEFLNKYEKNIRYECSKRSYLPGFSIEDLIQECKIKLLAGYHKYRKKKSKEITWVINVIRNTLDGIWNYTLKQMRTCYIETEDGKKPVYNYSIDNYIVNDGEKSMKLEEVYSESPDERPVFATTPENPEELLFILNIIQHLKQSLPPESYEYIKNKIFPENSYKEIMEMENKFNDELAKEGFTHIKVSNEFDIWCVMSPLTEKETTILCQAAEVFIGLGFDKNDILQREDMIDAVL